MTQLPPAGWYSDPDERPGLLRYWDGSVWTDQYNQSSIPQGSLPDPQPQVGSPWGTYCTDLKWSASTLWSSPQLVIVSLGIIAIFDLSTRQIIRPAAVTGLLVLAVEVFLVGFIGAQRVWFLRKLRGVRFDAREMWTLPWSFFGRFLCLDLLVTLIAIPFFVPAILITLPRHADSTANPHIPPLLTVGALVGAFLFDVALTFVVPALALNVRSVRASIRLGWRMTKRTWPTNVWYMFAPGITLVAVAAALPISVAPSAVYVCVGLLTTLVSLWFKGAAVAFYVRSVVPASVDGSAFV